MRLLVIAKQPLPGKAKTRLSPTFSPTQAASLAHAALIDTMRTVETVPCEERILLLDGDPTGLTRPGWSVRAQSDGPLDTRLAAGFEQSSDRPAFLVGMDTPQLDRRHLQLDPAADAWLGLAEDGGFWGLGFADPSVARRVVPGVPMSRPDTGAIQHRRLLSAGLRVQLLPQLRDIDLPEDAEAVARAYPDTEFAARWRDYAGQNPVCAAAS